MKANDRVTLTDDVAPGTVSALDYALERAYVRWDDGSHGWNYIDSLKHIDVIRGDTQAAGREAPEPEAHG